VIGENTHVDMPADNSTRAWCRQWRMGM
jgi:hypothetical protein